MINLDNEFDKIEFIESSESSKDFRIELIKQSGTLLGVRYGCAMFSLSELKNIYQKGDSEIIKVLESLHRLPLYEAEIQSRIKAILYKRISTHLESLSEILKWGGA